MAYTESPNLAPQQTNLRSHLSKVQAGLDDGRAKQVRRTLKALAPVEIARLIAALPAPSRPIVWELVDKDDAGEVLFPHIYGGIHPDVVTNTYPVTRDHSGRFLSIGLDSD